MGSGVVVLKDGDVLHLFLVLRRHEKTCLRGFTNNTGADQPAHPRSLISAFVIAFWKVPYLSLLQAEFHFSSESL